MKHLLTVLSYEEFTKLTGLTAEKLEKIFTKSEHIEQKLIEGMHSSPLTLSTSRQFSAIQKMSIIYHYRAISDIYDSSHCFISDLL